MSTTLLKISGIGVTPYSARGLTQTLEIIPAGVAMRRTVNGSLVDITAPQFRKYRSTISCTDQQPPPLDKLAPNMILEVECVSQLAYLTASGSPERTPVTGSSYVEGDFTFYRPKLNMRVTGFRITEDEYGASIGWQLDLEEA